MDKNFSPMTKSDESFTSAPFEPPFELVAPSFNCTYTIKQKSASNALRKRHHTFNYTGIERFLSIEDKAVSCRGIESGQSERGMRTAHKEHHVTHRIFNTRRVIYKVET